MIKLITEGQLSSGRKLPGSRYLANSLNVNRKTIIQAYDELVAQGWAFVVPSSGTYVTEDLPLTTYRSTSFSPFQSSPVILSQSFEHIQTFSDSAPSEIEINDGSPDYRLAPVDWIYKECRSLANSNYGKKLLKYDNPKGDSKLRQKLAEYLSETRGMKVSHEQILITRGSQMGIFLACNALLSKGKVAIVGDTSYDAADWTIAHHGGRIIRVSVDKDGLNTNELEEICKAESISLVYITPHHHFPTTVTLSNERRIYLLQLALKYNFAIVEDDYDYDFHYNSNPIMPLASLRHQDHVIYIGSFSKIFAPTIRIGYVVASEEFINAVSRLRRIIDRQGDHVMERVVAESLSQNELSRHLKKVVKEYRLRRNLFCDLLRTNLSDHIEFDIPEGGMAVWARFKKPIDLNLLSERLSKNGVHLNTDKRYQKSHQAVRLGFASLNEKEIDRVVNSLGVG